MANGILTEDGNTDWYQVMNNDGVLVSGKGDFGSGTITLQQRVSSTAYSLLDSSGAALSYTDDFNTLLEVRKGDIIRLSLGSSTGPDIDWNLAGDMFKL